MNFFSKAIATNSRPTDMKRNIKLFAIGVLLLSVVVGLFLIVNSINQIISVHTGNFVGEVSQAQEILQTDISTGNIRIAQQHIENAQTELDILRPVIETLLRAGNSVANLPGGGRIQQAEALWTFANAATELAQQSLAIAAQGRSAFDSGGIAGVVAVIPDIESQLQQTAQVYVAARQARQNLGDIDWLPSKQAQLLQKALGQWDEATPYLEIIFQDSGRILAQIPVQEVWTHTQTLTQSADVLSSLAASGRIDDTVMTAVPQQLTTIRAAFEALQTELSPLITYLQTSEHARTLNIPIEQFVAWEAFFDALTLGGKELAEAMTLGMTNVEQSGLPGLASSTPELYQHIQKAKTAFRRTGTLRADLQLSDSVPAEIAVPLRKMLATWDEVSPKITQLFSTADNVFKVMPQLLGYEHPVSYLLLIQSSDELRATGGFIGGIGTVRIDRGQVVETSLREVTELDNSPEVNGQYLTRWTQPPAPLAKYMGLGHWYLRDANWWADFPTTARQAADIWAINHTAPLDGVIAITEQGVVDLLDALGTVQTLDGSNIDASNLKDTAAERIYQDDRSPGVAQSALINEMTLALVEGTKNFSSDRVLNLVRYFQKATARHDILIASFDPPTTAGLFSLGLYGALGGLQDDYFYLVETNVSYNKLSPFIQQDLRYEVQLNPDGSPQEASLTVDEINTYLPGKGVPGYPDGYYDGGRWNPETRRVEQWKTYYGGYTRLYPPPNTKLVAAIGFDEGPDAMQEAQRMLVGGYVGIISGESRQLRFKWQPNVTMSRPGEYRLFVQRQPGAPEHSLTVLARLPQGYTAQAVSPLPISVADNIVTWHTVLDKDRIFSLTVVPTGDNNIARTLAVSATEETKPQIVAAITSTVAETSTFQVAPAPPAAPGRAPFPKRIKIPAIKVDAPIINVGLEPSGIMASPDDAAIVGWYELGPRPGESSNAILAGHVDWKGKIGVFSELDALKIGDKIEVESGPNTNFEFVVESIEQYSTDNAPLADIFGGTSQSTITLITCGGTYDVIRQEYKDRLIVRARKVEP